MAKTKLRIKELLQERNMTQAELADKLGISRMTLNQNLYRNTFSLAKLEEIADAIADIISDKTVWLDYSRHARKTAKQTFDENVFFEKIETIVRSAVNGGRDK